MQGREALDAAMTERDFQRQVRELAETLGWTTFCTWSSRHSPEGEPDLRLVRPPRVIFAELKTEKGRLTAAQRDALAQLSRCNGVEAYVWRPRDWDEIVEVLS